ncbi:hypothetical protein [Candidatus Liberibacter sp.]|uniref:hypothetical protein n=1 Tax=Candidatus Liberibacter sp. TaxID=34022 RepID=UPI0015F63A62|nr:hypothetical protein [Candidatus Liberibacter sp.]MBA5724618.1 hypothetical protein [Candidatus Liberibacter sp.]
MNIKTHKYITFIVIACLLSACSMSQIWKNGQKESFPIIGSWEHSSGIISEFYRNGTFKTISTDRSNTVLAKGFYQSISSKGIEIKLTSIMRNMSEIIQCNFVNHSKLNCVSKDRGQFYLERLTSSLHPKG